ncbi:MAG: hypothetical protein MJ224_02630 [archaeon]|nr:hypothetical protein [archaeon]
MENENAKLLMNCLNLVTAYFLDKTKFAEMLKFKYDQELKVLENIITAAGTNKTTYKVEAEKVKPLSIEEDFDKIEKDEPNVLELDYVKEILTDYFKNNSYWGELINYIDSLLCADNLSALFIEKEKPELPEVVEAYKNDLAISFINQLSLSGEMELPEEIIDLVEDYLFNNFNSYSLYIRNNKVKLELK